MVTSTQHRVAAIRRIGWLAVASMLALAVLAPGASPAAADSFHGAIWTTTADGTTVNGNLYESKDHVYLNGGPQNCGHNNGLPDGVYYFQVTDPSGKVLLSTDAISHRQVAVVNGVITGNGGGDHLEGTGNCNGGLPVQLMPYADTPNNGGEYSVDLARQADVEACEAFDADSTTFNFLACAPSKNDNFKVRAGPAPSGTPEVTATPAITATPGITATPAITATPGVTATPAITVAPTQSVLAETGAPTSSVLAETGSAAVTLPPSDTITGVSAPSDSWRLIVVTMAVLLASVLVLTQSIRTERATR